MIHHNGPHADQHIVFQGTTMYDRIMADAAEIAYGRGCLLVGAVDDCAILYVDLVADPDAIHIAPYDRIEPEATMVADNDISYDGGVFSHKAAFA